MPVNNKVNRFLSKPLVIGLLFLASIGLMYGASQWVNSSGIILLDEEFAPADIRMLIAQMSEAQKLAHIRLTATIDVFLPFALGGFLAGVALRFYPRYGFYLALPALIAIPVDLFEGVVQVLALSNTADWLFFKAYVTPLKLLFYGVGLLVAMFAWLRWLLVKLLLAVRGDKPRSAEL